jgi:hypothetical protein
MLQLAGVIAVNGGFNQALAIHQKSPAGRLNRGAAL